MNFLDNKSELVLEKLKVILHTQENQRWKSVAITIPDERFVNKGYTLETLKTAMINIYKFMYNEKSDL